MTKRLRWHRRGSGLVTAAVLALVAALAAAAPASANTTTGRQATACKNLQ